MCGLCGNFDGNVNNDLVSSNNQLEVDSSHFGNSWKVVPSCADVTQVKSGLKSKGPCAQITKQHISSLASINYAWMFKSASLNF